MNLSIAAWRDLVSAEQERFFLWVPVLYGAGVAAYFSLPAEPSLWALAPGCLLVILAAWQLRRTFAGMVLAGLMIWPALGLLAAKIATERARAPVLERPVRSGIVTGWVELIEAQANGDKRLTIRVATLAARGYHAATPRRIRVRAPDSGRLLAIGDAVRITARLLPPGAPALPGAYDFARSAWFQRLGAVGYSRQPPEPITLAQPMPWGLALWLPVERLRARIGDRIRNQLSGETAEIAVALITGERGGISDATNDRYRDAGIFHILSISGLHMTVFAGALFFAARMFLSLLPVLALRYPIKKWAAVVGLVGTAGYLGISGGSPPAVRSAAMLAIMFLAVLLDRPALALRNVALAAIAILLISPSSLIDVGFQMSFAAVVALIAGVEAWQTHTRDREARPPRSSRGALAATLTFIVGIVASTLLATAAVAPFAAHYFHKSTQFGALANLVAIPLCNLIVMPAALATMIAMPFSLEAWPLALMGIGIDGMGWVATQVAALPGAVLPVPAMPTAAFLCMVLGGVWLALWQTRLRLLGLAAFATGLMIAPNATLPDILIAGNGDLVAIRGPDRRLAVLDSAHSRYELARWLEYDGDARNPDDVGPGRTFLCDAISCLANVRGNTIAIPRHPSAFQEDCQRATVVIWLHAGSVACPSKATLVTLRELARDGTHALVLGSEGRFDPRSSSATTTMSSATVIIATVAQRRGLRPWVGGGYR